MILPIFSLPAQILPPIGQKVWFAFLLGFTGIMFISRVSIPKPGGEAYVVFPVLALVAVAVWLLRFRISLIQF